MNRYSGNDSLEGLYAELDDLRRNLEALKVKKVLRVSDYVTMYNLDAKANDLSDEIVRLEVPIHVEEELEV